MHRFGKPLLRVQDRGGAERPADGPSLLVRLPVASEVPFDRGGLGSAGLSSSAQDMTRYLSLYLNQGRHGATALISPAGAAELQRAGVSTGLDGVSYAMGWDVGSVHGVSVVSHDGSGFDSHPNVVLIPDRGWGVVTENGENSPDELFAACGPSAAGAQIHCGARRELYESGSAWAYPCW